MPQLHLRFFGAPEIERDGKIITIARRKSLVTLIYLAVTGKTQQRDTLATLFWPESDQANARTRLRRELWELNQLLGEEWLDTKRETVALRSGADIWLDTKQYEASLVGLEGRGAAVSVLSAQQIQRIEQAVALYRGDFLAGFTLPDCPEFDNWQFFQAQTYRQMLAMALDTLVAVHQGRNEFDLALPYARRRLALDPLHEPAHRQLMALYAHLDQWALALHQYAECERILDEDLGVPPQQATVDLYEAIHRRRIDPPRPLTSATNAPYVPIAVNENGSLTAAEPLADTLRRPKHNLLFQTTPLFGRAKELAALAEQLADRHIRLVTITGVGGMGKTRLAQEVGMALLNAYRDGVFFVPLAPLRRSQDAVTALAKALDFPFQPGPRAPKQQLFDYLHQKQMLLILDNCEHLLDGIEQLVGEILATAPEVVILATSRERLKLTGEALFGLAGIGYVSQTDSEYSDAMQLFVNSAQLVRSDFRPKDDDLLHVDRICRLVQGMPLGILLAAAWMELLSPQEIADQIGRSLDFLEADLKDLPPRQRSLRAVFDHSWALLAQEEQCVLASLSVFQGSFDLKAAGAISGGSLRSLMTLVRKSLLGRLPNGRFEMHELLRQYGAKRLSLTEVEQQIARNQHMNYYLNWLHDLTADLHSMRQLIVMEEMDLERENLRLAWEHATEVRQRDLLTGAMGSLGQFYEWYGRYPEGADAFQQAIRALVDDGSAAGRHDRARLLIQQARLQRLLGRGTLADELLLTVESLLNELQTADVDIRPARAALLRERAEMLRSTDKRTATQLAGEALALYETVGDQVGQANILFGMGVTAHESGLFDEAAMRLEESLTISRGLGGPRDMAFALSLLGFTWMGQGRSLDEAEPLVQESYSLFQKMGNRASLARGLRDLGGLQAVRGDAVAAEALIVRSRDAYAELGDMGNVIDTTQHVVELIVAQGRYDEARSQAMEALSLARSAEQTRAVGVFVEILGQIALAENNPHEAYSRLTEAAQIFEESGGNWWAGILSARRALAARLLGQDDVARGHLVSALEHVLEGQGPFQLGAILAVAALLKADEGEVEQALALDALIKRQAIYYPQMAQNCWWWDTVYCRLTALTGHVPALSSAATAQNLDLAKVASELLAEFRTKIEG